MEDIDSFWSHVRRPQVPRPGPPVPGEEMVGYAIRGVEDPIHTRDISRYVADLRSSLTDDETKMSSKAMICVFLAQRILGANRTATDIENQAIDLMNLPESALLSTYRRVVGT